MTETPMARIARAIVRRREQPPKCRQCGAPITREQKGFCSDKHVDLWNRENVW